MVFALGPLILLAIVVSVIWFVAKKARDRTPETPFGRYVGGPMEPAGATPIAAPSAKALDASLARWVEAGLLAPDQATAIERFELEAHTAHLAAKPPRRVPVVAEALGYLGGTLGIVGLVLLLTKYWPDLGTPARLALAGVGAVGFTVAGYLVKHDHEPALERLRQFVWLVATAAGGLTAGVVAINVANADYAGTVVLAVAATIAVHSALLWRNTAHPVQQVTCLVAALVALGTLADQFTANGPTGLVVWTGGLAVLAVGVWHLTSTPSISVGIGGLGTLVGASISTSDWRGPGLLLLTATAAGLVVLAGASAPLRSKDDRFVLMVVAAMGIFLALPQTIVHFADNAGLVTGLVMWAVGGTLVVLASTRIVHAPILAQLLGGLLIVGGAAVTGAQSVAFATVFGFLTAVALIGVGTLPDHVLMSIFGSLGLLVNVPWAIRHFFPGEGRVPLLIFVSGMLIVGVAVWLNHLGGQLRRGFHHFAGH